MLWVVPTLKYLRTSSFLDFLHMYIDFLYVLKVSGAHRASFLLTCNL